MKKPTHSQLSRRERQIMDILYRRGEASASEVRELLPQSPGYSAVRAMLRVLEEKGHIGHEAKDLRYVYSPTVPRDSAKESALQHLVTTFFDGSVEQVVATLLNGSAAKVTQAELDRLAKLIHAAKKQGEQQ